MDQNQNHELSPAAIMELEARRDVGDPDCLLLNMVTIFPKNSL